MRAALVDSKGVTQGVGHMSLRTAELDEAEELKA
jgi:hypothetical protein